MPASLTIQHKNAKSQYLSAKGNHKPYVQKWKKMFHITNKLLKRDIKARRLAGASA